MVVGRLSIYNYSIEKLSTKKTDFTELELFQPYLPRVPLKTDVNEIKMCYFAELKILEGNYDSYDYILQLSMEKEGGKHNLESNCIEKK